ncbi:hypothetical protein EZV76_02445 [Flagellimonas alvinocaridis]|uniref:DUF4293 family protein n=1 Tax=Flagellimonas alvinocaridis TaxID=2530200 RepID=A0A4S8RR74_9FLAO|nr:DUF6168 family protein [Allomuricauda alvinocaridis]THV61207.1 hypothetical protein EZV76_02445 [Allomuricauda alvinocaridis]
MLKQNIFIQFTLLLLLLLLLAFGIHLFVLISRDLAPFGNLIVRSYVVNGLLATTIFGLLYRFREKLKNQMGFLFMAGSLLKFVFFFLLFYPTYKADGEMSGLEFAAFFVPYAIALLMETYFMSKILKNLEEASKE